MKVDDTIYRQAAIDICMRKDVHTGYDAACLIVQLPSAQPEDYAYGFADGYKQGEKDAQPEIIRCKDCKHKRRYKFPPKYDEKDYCSINERVVTADDFCSRAERRTDE